MAIQLAMACQGACLHGRGDSSGLREVPTSKWTGDSAGADKELHVSWKRGKRPNLGSCGRTAGLGNLMPQVDKLMHHVKASWPWHGVGLLLVTQWS